MSSWCEAVALSPVARSGSGAGFERRFELCAQPIGRFLELWPAESNWWLSEFHRKGVPLPFSTYCIIHLGTAGDRARVGSGNARTEDGGYRVGECGLKKLEALLYGSVGNLAAVVPFGFEFAAQVRRHPW